jgi:hypothetical protein
LYLEEGGEMRSTAVMASAILSGLAFLLPGCSTGPEYEDRTEELSTVLKYNVEQIFDNGFMISFNEILVPSQYSQDGFYLVDSPDMLDSVFQEINYPSPESPRLDTLFPDGGSLLVLDHHLIWGDELLDYACGFNGDTVRVSLSVRRWLNRVYDPGLRYLVVPIGIVFETPVD